MQRRVFSWVRVFHRRSLWFPVMLVLIGAALWTVGQGSPAQDGAEPWVSTWVRIDQRLIRVEHGETGTETRIPLLFFELETGDGAVHAISHRVSRDVFLSTDPGSARIVQYRANDPTTLMVSPTEPSVLQLVSLTFVNNVAALGVLGAIALAAGLGVGIIQTHSVPSMRRAQRDGEVREALVTGRARSRLNIVFRPPRWHLTWRDAVGQSGRSRPFPAADLPAADSVIVVYVDPRSGQGWWEEEF